MDQCYTVLVLCVSPLLVKGTHSISSLKKFKDFATRINFAGQNENFNDVKKLTEINHLEISIFLKKLKFLNFVKTHTSTQCMGVF